MNASNRGRIPEAYCHWLGEFFFVEGMDRQDIAQEARLAAWLAPCGYERRHALHRVIDLLRRSQRRPAFALSIEDMRLVDGRALHIVEDRETLREIVEADLTDNERIAVGRRLRGEPIRRHEHALDMAWFRVKRRLADAA